MEKNHTNQVWQLRNHYQIEIHPQAIIKYGQISSIKMGFLSHSWSQLSTQKQEFFNRLLSGEFTENEALETAFRMGGHTLLQFAIEVITKCKGYNFLYYWKQATSGLRINYYPVELPGMKPSLLFDQPFVFSKFLIARWEAGALIRLECPKPPFGTVYLKGDEWNLVMGLLASPISIEQMQINTNPSIELNAVYHLVQLLYALGFVVSTSVGWYIC